ncbi:MAG: sulfatase [Aureliella sp.]
MIILARAIVALVVVVAAAVTAAAERPNVLFIVSDDLNTALSGMGHPECRTPNLDKFAKTGVTFTRAFCQFPLCGPSRASIMTGQYPLANGVTSNGGEVAQERVTLPVHFANHGYSTARVSKIYHMGIPVDIVEGTPGRDHAPSWRETHNITALEALTPGKAEDFQNPETVKQFPEERQKWLAAQKGGKPYRFTQVARAQYASIEVEEKNQHLLADTMAANKAIEILRTRAARDEPFFLAVGLVRPHFPFIATDTLMDQYDADELFVPNVPSNDLEDIPAVAHGSILRFEKSPIQKMRRAYYGAVSFMDSQVGRILAELDSLQIRDNTIVVFVSDHGYLLGEHHMWKKAKLWEEAIRVPLIISAPGMTQGVLCNHFVELVDLYPTITNLAGLPPDPSAQGQSLVTLLDDPNTSLEKADALIQVRDGFGLRSGRWAWMWYPKSKKNKRDSFMLYDLNNDPHQYTNLADLSEYAAVRKRLHRRLLTRIAAAKK